MDICMLLSISHKRYICEYFYRIYDDAYGYSRFIIRPLMNGVCKGYLNMYMIPRESAERYGWLLWVWVE